MKFRTRKESENIISVSDNQKTVDGVEKLTSFSRLIEKHEETVPDGIPWFLASLIFVNALVGAGILNFPYSIYAAGGIYFAIGVQSVLVIMLYFSLTTMVCCSHLCKSAFYQDTVYEYLGSFGRYICALLILFFSFLITSTYMIAIGEQLGAGVKIIFGHNHHWYLNESYILAIVCLVIIFPLCLVKSIDRLHIASTVASASLLLLAFIVIYEYYHFDTHNVRTIERPKRWSDLFLSVPGFSMAYMFDLSSVAVYGRMKRKTVNSFMKACALAMGSVFIFNNVFSVYAYLTFGVEIDPNFMTNYSQGSWIIAIAQFTYSLKLCLEYPIYQYLGWTAICTFVDESWSSTDNDKHNDGAETMRLLTSVFWLISTFLVTFYASNINYVVPMVGATILHFQYTFPGLCLLRALGFVTDYLSATKICFLRVYGVILVIFGLGLSSIVIFQSVSKFNKVS